MGSDREGLLTTQVHWLSHGKLLKDLLNLRMMLVSQNPKSADFFWDDKWLPVIYYVMNTYKTIEALALFCQKSKLFQQCIKK